MIPGKYNLPKIKKGDTFNGVSFAITLNGVAVDFTSAVIKMQLRKNATSAVVLEWTTADGSITVSGNTVTIGTKTGAQMTIEPGTYIYDLQALLGNGVTNTYVEGTIIIVQDITR